jgi:hypothetical protein
MGDEQNTFSVSKPFYLSILCVVIFVYSGFFILLFLIGIIYRGWITRILHDYVPERNITPSQVLLICLIFMVLYGLSFWSALLLWKLKRIGLYLYIAGCFGLSVVPVLAGFGNYLSPAVFAFLILSVSLFSRRLK